MANRGRPRKAGKRKGGRPVAPCPEARMVKGNDKAEARKAAYGPFGGDCLGRAYVKGLLGEGQLGKDRLDIARRFARLYSKAFNRPYRCALNDNPRGGGNAPESDWERTGEDWMRDNLALLDPADHPYFDQLVLPASPLDDPHWMVGLIAGVEGVNGTNRQILNAALRGIDTLAHRPTPRKRPALDFLPKYGMG